MTARAQPVVAPMQCDNYGAIVPTTINHTVFLTSFTL